MSRTARLAIALLGVVVSVCMAEPDRGSPLHVDRATTRAALDCPTCVPEALRFRYTNNEASVLVVNRTVVNRAPSDLRAGQTYTFYADEALPPGLRLDTTTGVLSGTATAATPGKAYRIHAISPSSHRVATLWFEVEIAPEALPPEERSHQFFVSLSGSDANPGTFSAPFLTLKKALQGRKPGDTVNLRGGVYVGYQRFTSLGEADKAPITVRSYPGEQAILEATSVRFITPQPAPLWVRAVDQAPVLTDLPAHPEEYVSAKEFPAPPLKAGNETDWLSHAEFLDRTPYTRLLAYANLNDLRSNEQTSDVVPELGVAPAPGAPPEARRGPFYVHKTDCSKPANQSKVECLRPRRTWTYYGPGVYWNRATKRVHIRLSHTTNAAVGMTDYAGETDPNKLKIGISWKGLTTNEPSDPEAPSQFQLVGFLITVNKNLAFKYLSFRYGGQETIRLSGNINVTFDHVDIRASRWGVRVVEAGNEGTRIVHSRFSGGVPPWSFRTDYKENYEIDPIRSAAGSCGNPCICEKGGCETNCLAVCANKQVAATVTD